MFEKYLKAKKQAAVAQKRLDAMPKSEKEEDFDEQNLTATGEAVKRHSRVAEKWLSQIAEVVGDAQLWLKANKKK